MKIIKTIKIWKKHQKTKKSNTRKHIRKHENTKNIKTRVRGRGI